MTDVRCNQESVFVVCEDLAVLISSTSSQISPSSGGECQSVSFISITMKTVIIQTLSLSLESYHVVVRRARGKNQAGVVMAGKSSVSR